MENPQRILTIFQTAILLRGFFSFADANVTTPKRRRWPARATQIELTSSFHYEVNGKQMRSKSMSRKSFRLAGAVVKRCYDAGKEEGACRSDFFPARKYATVVAIASGSEIPADDLKQRVNNDARECFVSSLNNVRFSTSLTRLYQTDGAQAQTLLFTKTKPESSAFAPATR